MKLTELYRKFLFFLIITTLSQVIFLKNTDANNLDYMHGIAMHGDLKYPKDFKKFDYADENAFKAVSYTHLTLPTTVIV